MSAADLLDLRGRSDRRGLLKAACVVIAFQLLSSAAATALTGAPAAAAVFSLQSAVLWLSLVAISKRLHDLGYGLSHALAGIFVLGGLAVATGIAVAATWGEAAILPGAPGYLAVAAVTVAPMLSAAIWLHAMPGDSGANKYGAAPGPSGFASAEPQLDSQSLTQTR